MRCLCLTLVGLVVAACGADTQPLDPANLDRPTAVSFACVGDMIVNPGQADERIEFTAQPVTSCLQWQEGAPAGQEPLLDIDGFSRPELQAFLVQSAKGTLALLRRDPANVVVDTDPFTPGRNAIPVGTLPVASHPDESGCYMMTANAGSCDLSVVDITTAVNILETSRVNRVPIINASGQVVDAKPRAFAASKQSDELGVACPSTPTGSTYIAYPACNLVAMVDLSTGQIQGGVQFRADGSAAIVDGDVSCASQCGGGQDMTLPPDAGTPVDAAPDDAGGPDAGAPPMPPMPDDGAPRPVTVFVDDTGTRLLIGAENSPAITVVDLDDVTGLPTGSRSIVLEGDIGVSKLKLSEVIRMGGNTGSPGGTAGDFEFIYAIASDRTIRVVDINGGVECDTNVDPRYLQTETNISFLACMPVGGVDTPPRRAGTRSPGIETPRDSVPLDVAFATVARSIGVEPGPADMAGTFAFITTSDSFILVSNIDDDIANDFENQNNPEATFIATTIPHQLRDFVNRAPTANASLDPLVLRRGCALPDPDERVLPPRLRSGVFRDPVGSQIDSDKSYEMPFPRTLQCDVRDENNEITDTIFVGEMSFPAPVDLREKVFPDLRAIRNEQWTFTWEGPLSLDDVNTAIDGPSVRSGIFEVQDGFRVKDLSGSFCEIGVEPYDIVRVAGCDPTIGDAQCGLGETCFVHPDSPAEVAFGTCLPDDRTDVLSARCRDYLVSRKQYAVSETRAGELKLRPRRRILDTSPLEGCVSDEQCVEMEELDRLLKLSSHPAEADLSGTETGFSWTCADDPSRAPGVPRCLMTCTDDDSCEPGFSCSNGGFCVEGPVPPDGCLVTLQRFQVRAGESFAVVGASSGFLHNRIVDEATGECIDDPDGNPLLVGRLPLQAPACVGDGFTDLSPNPCSTEILQQEFFAPFELVGDTCEPVGDGGAIQRDRMAPAVRFSNPSFTFHMIDLVTNGDDQCRNDRVGTYPLYTAVHRGLNLGLDLTGGFVPMFVQFQNVLVRFPVAVTRAFDGSLWVLDQGDVSGAVQGRVVVINPAAGQDNFSPSFFQ